MDGQIGRPGNRGSSQPFSPMPNLPLLDQSPLPARLQTPGLIRGLRGPQPARSRIRGSHMMKKIQVAAAVALALSSVSFAQQAVQWKVSEGGNGHWYLPTTQVFDHFRDASAWAQARGAHLVTLTSSEENAFAANLAPGDFLLGGYQDVTSTSYSEPSGGWRWVTNEPWVFTAWNPGEPQNGGWPDLRGEHYLAWWRYGSPTNPLWNDVGNDMTVPPWNVPWNLPAIVEWSADCNNDGIVDYGQCRDGSLPDYNGNNIPDCCESGTTCVVGSYPVQWRAEDGGNGHWFQLGRRDAVVSWASADAASVSSAGYLASILSEAEDIFVFNVANRPGAWQGYLGPWLGGRQVPGTGEPLGLWVWSSGEPWGYVGPDSSFPNNGGPPGTDENRLHYIDFARKWNDLPENGSPENGGGVRAFVTEWSADCNNDGLVDKGQILRGQLADSDNDGIPNVCECVCDVFRDFNVNGIDLGVLLGQWGPANQFTVTDFNQDGSVDGFDLGVLLGAWGPCPN